MTDPCNTRGSDDVVIDIEDKEKETPCSGDIEIPKKKKKNCKKPPKPPRPPSLDAAEAKLARESLKHARLERMKALKKMKNGKPTSWALLVTVLYGLVLVWQGSRSRSGSDLRFQGSPASSEFLQP